MLFWKFSDYVPKDNQRNEMWGLLEIPYVGKKQEREKQNPKFEDLRIFENLKILFSWELFFYWKQTKGVFGAYI